MIRSLAPSVDSMTPSVNSMTPSIHSLTPSFHSLTSQDPNSAALTLHFAPSQWPSSPSPMASHLDCPNPSPLASYHGCNPSPHPTHWLILPATLPKSRSTSALTQASGPKTPTLRPKPRNEVSQPERSSPSPTVLNSAAQVPSPKSIGPIAAAPKPFPSDT